MIDFLKVLIQHIRDYPPDYGYGESILDVLFWFYTEHNNGDNEKIKAQFTKLREHLNLPAQEYDEVFYIVSDLCILHGRAAFAEGVRLGVQLMKELA